MRGNPVSVQISSNFMVYSSKFTQTSPISQFFWHYPTCNKFWVRSLLYRQKSFLQSCFGVHLMSHHSKWSLAIILNDLYCSFSLYSTSLHSAEIPNYLDFSLEFRIEAKSNLWKLASQRKTKRSWRHDGKYHLVLVHIYWFGFLLFVHRQSETLISSD